MSVALQLSDPAPNPKSLVEVLTGKQVTAGVYGDGALTICEAPGLELPEAWRFVLPSEMMRIYAYSCHRGFYFCNDVGSANFIGDIESRLVVLGYSSMSAAVGLFFDDEEFQADTFELYQCAELIEAKGPLRFGECYALQPMMILGGNEDVESCQKVNFAVQMEIASQTLMSIPLAQPELLQ
jgi:T6SS immunity protein Tdi1, C-terminal